ncbi:MAG: YdeI/OmpD-associated family protein [Anaerolineae bacterium]|nr:YdeI/OmpD-associated family protein [Anaerolineae bacterium]
MSQLIPDKFANLDRDIQPMPDFVHKALMQHGVMDDYRARPAYQQNDYLSWINRAKQESTKQKRLNQMLDELKKGGVYMNMKHPASEK